MKVQSNLNVSTQAQPVFGNKLGTAQAVTRTVFREGLTVVLPSAVTYKYTGSIPDTLQMVAACKFGADGFGAIFKSFGLIKNVSELNLIAGAGPNKICERIGLRIIKFLKWL